MQIRIFFVQFFEHLVFNVWIAKFEKDKIEDWGKSRGKKGHRPFKLPRSHFSWRERGFEQLGWCNNSGCLLLCLHLLSEAEIGDQSIDPWCLEGRVLFPTLATTSYVRAALEAYAGGWPVCGVDNCYCVKSWNWWKWTTIYCPVLSLEVSGL